MIAFFTTIGRALSLVSLKIGACRSCCLWGWALGPRGYRDAVGVLAKGRRSPFGSIAGSIDDDGGHGMAPHREADEEQDAFLAL